MFWFFTLSVTDLILECLFSNDYNKAALRRTFTLFILTIK